MTVDDVCMEPESVSLEGFSDSSRDLMECVADGEGTHEGVEQSENGGTVVYEVVSYDDVVSLVEGAADVAAEKVSGALASSVDGSFEGLRKELAGEVSALRSELSERAGTSSVVVLSDTQYSDLKELCGVFVLEGVVLCAFLALILGAVVASSFTRHWGVGRG